MDRITSYWSPPRINPARVKVMPTSPVHHWVVEWTSVLGGQVALGHRSPHHPYPEQHAPGLRGTRRHVSSSVPGGEEIIKESIEHVGVAKND